MLQLQLVDLHKSYTIGPLTVEVLRGVSLEVQRGDMVSIMGPSGSGKSTLMNLIGLLDQPSSGSYRLEEREVSAMTDNELATIRNTNIGFVFQSFHLLARLTAVDNVGLPLVYRGVKTRDRRRRAEDMLAKVGMLDRATHKPHELSGGQQQRVAIARALVGQPAIVLADEPTGALDPHTGAEIMQLFRRLNIDDGITLIVITHDAEVARQCRRQTAISEGMLHDISQGNADQPAPLAGDRQ